MVIEGHLLRFLRYPLSYLHVSQWSVAANVSVFTIRQYVKILLGNSSPLDTSRRADAIRPLVISGPWPKDDDASNWIVFKFVTDSPERCVLIMCLLVHARDKHHLIYKRLRVAPNC